MHATSTMCMLPAAFARQASRDAVQAEQSCADRRCWMLGPVPSPGHLAWWYVSQQLRPKQAPKRAHLGRPVANGKRCACCLCGLLSSTLAGGRLVPLLGLCFLILLGRCMHCLGPQHLQGKMQVVARCCAALLTQSAYTAGLAL